MASTSPWIMFRIEMYAPFLVVLETMMFLVCKSLRMTSSTVVFLITPTCVRREYVLLERDGGVPGHEEMAARSGDQRGQQSDQVVVHVAGVAQR